MEVQRRDAFSDRPLAATRTNTEGLFRFGGCGIEPQSLMVIDPAAAFMTPVLRAVVTPGPGTERLTAPRASAALLLRALDAAGRALDAAEVRLLMARVDGLTLQIGKGRAAATPDGLRIAPLVAGTYDVVLSTGRGGSRFVGRFQLADGATLDAGDVRFEPPGEVEIAVRDVTGAPRRGLLMFTDPRAAHAGDHVLLADGVGRTSLQPGRRLLSFWTEDLPMTFRELTVESGGRHRVEIVVPPSVRRRVAFGGVREPVTFLEVTGVDAAGKQVLHHPCARTGKRGEVVTRAFVPGSYELVVRDLAGRERRSRFTISADENADEVVEVLAPASQ
jgi:hypothetical protein